MGWRVIVRAMSGAERDQFQQSCMIVRADGKHEADMRNVQAKLVAMCAVDEEGNLLFGPDEVEHLAAKSAVAIERLFDVAQRFNRLAPRATRAAGKNSSP